MADEHFWDNGVGSISTEENCKLKFENLEGIVKTTPFMSIDKALQLMEVLKNGRETVKCEAFKVVDGEDEPIQSFSLNVIEVDGKKIIV